MKAIAVIGSMFGDCGKGRMVHHFAANSKSATIVVRYNGGAQAGHTVVCDDKVGHIFHHFGSGTLDGAATYLSEFFICNPLLWKGEHEDLCGVLPKPPKLYIHPASPVTTPYDMLINREVERSRGAQRHGSCGYGVNETVERLCNGKHPLFVRHIEGKDFQDRVKAIRDQYVPKRLNALGITTPSDGMREACASDKLWDEFMACASGLLKNSTPMIDPELKRLDTVVFEGSQGLGLDERHKFFPHVTRSRTGLDNIVEICSKADIKQIEAVYATRAYATRHGFGPMTTEDPALSYDDPTNVENEWQGAIRFGHLDIDLLQENIRNDLKKKGSLKVDCSLAITCMDQVGDSVKVRLKGQDQQVRRDDLPKIVAKVIGAKQVYLSWNR